MSITWTNDWGIDDIDYVQLREVGLLLKPKRVLEFGPGRSTTIWAELDCEVDTVESDGAYAECATRALGRDARVRVHTCSSLHELTLPYEHYDLGFVDGPPGHKYHSCSRLDVVEYALARSTVVLLHDSKRRGERETLAFLRGKGWDVSALESPRGIALIERTKAI